MDLAIAAWEEALRIQPNYALAQNGVAKALVDRERFGEAEAHFRLAIRFDPEYADAHFNYATLLIGRGRLAEAESERSDLGQGALQVQERPVAEPERLQAQDVELLRQPVLEVLMEPQG